MVDPGGTEHCFKFWCTVFRRHEYYAYCTCGYSARSGQIAATTAALLAHLGGIRSELANGSDR